MKTILFTNKSRRRTLTISTVVYDSMRDFILETVAENDGVTFTSLLDKATSRKDLLFEGNLSWTLLSVKRDLEVRGVINVKIGFGHERAQIITLKKQSFKPTSKPIPQSSVVSTHNPTLTIRNSKPETRDSKPESRNAELETRPSKFESRPKLSFYY
jgi:hypothetical protein